MKRSTYIFIVLLLTLVWIAPLKSSAQVDFGAIGDAIGNISKAQGLIGAKPSVPTSDTGLNAKETGIKIFGFNIGVSWNQIALNVAKKVVNQVMDSTVNWFNSGFDGKPAYVTDPKSYFENLGNGIAGDIIKDSKLGFLCSPIQAAKLTISLRQVYTQPYTPQCTLTGIQGNIDDFYRNFTNGGWDTFIQLTQQPSNNPYGSFIEEQVYINQKVLAAVGAEKAKLDWGQGFKSQASCKKYNGYPEGTNSIADSIGNTNYNSNYAPGACIEEGPIKTPGSTLKTHLDESLPANSFLREITTADQFDKLLTALGNGLLRRFVFGQNGLLGKSSGGSSGSSGSTNTPPPTVECSASPDTGVMNVTKITWSAYSNYQDKAVSFTWEGDDGLLGAGDAITHIYSKFGIMNATAIASTTDLDDLGNYIPGTEKQTRFPCDTVKINQFPPLNLLSCKAPTATIKADESVTWTAIVSGGSGKLNGMQWSGGQTNFPGCSDPFCNIWGTGIIPNDPSVPVIYYSAPGKQAGVTLYTTTANANKTFTITATRKYYGNTGGKTGVQPGDSQDASFKLFDSDPDTLPLNADCGSVTIVP